MAYRLKKIQYKNQSYYILLQNENGPCPLLAAGNVLLLKESIALPSNCIGSGVVTIEELTNLLAERILTNSNSTTGSSDHHINEVMKIFPNLQFGMDVNPKFTAGPTGVEYTMELNAFDLLHVELVHGWLLESDAQEYEWVGDKTYNQLVNVVIEGNDASTKLQQNPQGEDYDELSNQATRGTVVRNFLDGSAHQLTQYGLTVLHEYVKEGDMKIFFRNNHYNTLTKYKDNLYLLVTDFGYADVPSVIWEKLDVIDGDTEYVNGEFQVLAPSAHHVDEAATGGHLVANNMQSQADYQLALQLSREATTDTDTDTTTTATATDATNIQREDSDIERAKKASLMEHECQQQEQPVSQKRHSSSTGDLPAFPTIAVGIPASHLSQEERDMMLAKQLQRQEEKQQQELSRQQRPRQQQQLRQSTTVQPRSKAAAKDSSCIIS